MEKIVVLITTPSKEIAEKMGSHLVTARLAACVNIVSCHSIFFWEGKCCNESEALMIIKTRRSLFAPLCAMVKQQHPYSVPEMIALPIAEGSAEYLQWIEDNTH